MAHDQPTQGTERTEGMWVGAAGLGNLTEDVGHDLDPGLAPPLFHYTTTDGMLGITTQLEVRASDARCMNDESERAYGQKLLYDYIGELRTAYCEPIVHEYLNAVQRSFSELRPLYVACFTELRDDLSQWRGYAAGKAGYALRFDNLYADGTRVVKIEYSLERQRYLLDQRVRRTAELLVQAGQEATCAQVRELLGWAVIGSVNQLTQILLICKDEAFAAEHEWRICYGRASDYPEEPFSYSWPGAELPLSFRASDLGVVPYVNLCLRGPGLPLTEILTAPGMDGTTAIAMVKAVCRERGLEGVDVNASKIPLRY